ncbi:SMP-30/gluconolactonase/LRE family protein [Methylobacterium bullatum]|uniref:Gluconolactonase n=1 Tax=Methylobacterium bullatum TaxID=570505 RepID=A0AAV4Z5D1_9HYPH|nr:SMP-30/gluconolactonase/LRE family protein [Methylobacterium bullatum]MBD8901217.1 gluconolactonase [Methylobacterium bullatum]GJD39146.1 Gluconolactonase [Methylobacterium bullatum]
MRRRDILCGLAASGLWSGHASAAPILRSDDPRFAELVDPSARPMPLYREGRWCEGLCWAPHLGGLIVSDVRSNRMLVIRENGEVKPFRDPSNNANGNILDAKGRLVTCEHRTRRVVRREPVGTMTVLADSYDGKPLNSPNDAALAPDGAIWFTDPVFGITVPDEGIQAVPAQSARRVYRIDPAGEVQGMTDAVGQPNGIAFAPDGHTLYVTETSAALDNAEGARAILAFPVKDRRLGEPRVVAALDAGAPDGLAIDEAGRIYAACADGVRIYLPDGTLLGRIATATPASNVEFGGADGHRLFISAGSVVAAIDLKVRGAAKAS